MSTMLVMKGPDMSAGSNPSFFVTTGRRPPIVFATVMTAMMVKKMVTPSMIFLVMNIAKSDVKMPRIPPMKMPMKSSFLKILK